MFAWVKYPLRSTVVACPVLAYSPTHPTGRVSQFLRFGAKSYRKATRWTSRWDPGEYALDIGLSEEDAVGRDRFSLFNLLPSQLYLRRDIPLLLPYVENIYTKRCLQTGKLWLRTQNGPNISIPHSILSLYQKPSMNARQYTTFSRITPMFFYLSHCITAMQVDPCLSCVKIEA